MTVFFFLKGYKASCESVSASSRASNAEVGGLGVLDV